MKSVIIALTENTGASEDYNLNYTHYIKVSSDTLDFSEDVFHSGQTNLSQEGLKKYLQGKGYAVEDEYVLIVETDESADDEQDDDEGEDEDE